MNFITEQAMPPFTIPDGAKYDQVINVLKLQASLYDVGTAALLATSAPVAYSIVPGISGKASVQTRKRRRSRGMDGRLARSITGIRLA